MNSICTNRRSQLTINNIGNIANLVFIDINGPSISIGNPKNHIKSWVVKRNCTKDTIGLIPKK